MATLSFPDFGIAVASQLKMGMNDEENKLMMSVISYPFSTSPPSSPSLSTTTAVSAEEEKSPLSEDSASDQKEDEVHAAAADDVLDRLRYEAENGKCLAYVGLEWEQIPAAAEDGTVGCRFAPERDLYFRETQKRLAKYETTKDYIQITKLYYESEVGPNGKLQAIEEPENTPMRVVFRPNDFLYAFADGISHYVVWATGAFTLKEVKELVEKHYPTKSYDTHVWMNQFESQSVTSILHWHVVVRNKVDVTDDRTSKIGK